MPKVSKQHIIQRKAEILSAAKRVFNQKGFEPATMQDVVTASGMSRGGVYQYFSSTDDMMRALLEENMDSGEKYIADLIQKHSKIGDALDDYLSSVEKDAGDPFAMAVNEYFVTGWRNKSRKSYLMKRYSKGKALFLRLLEEGEHRGEFSPLQPPEVIAQFLITVCDGLSLESNLLDNKTTGVAEQIKALKMYLKTVLRPGES